MSQKKGQVPAHIQVKQFEHPKAEEPWVFILNQIEDPRKPSCNTRHSITTILFIVFSTILCGAKNWEEMYYLAIGEDFSKWLSLYVDLSSGVPSKWTLERVTSLIPTEHLYPLFSKFKEHVQQARTIAIDGKTLRGTKDWDKGHPLHLLHAWSVEGGVCIGQVAVDEKSNEMTALPKILSQLNIKGSVITADAMHTQTTSVQAIKAQGGDYVLPVKKNHLTLFEEVEFMFSEADRVNFQGLDAGHTQTIEKKGGRVEERYYTLLDASNLSCIQDWEGCYCIGRVTRKRSKQEKVTEEQIYYITSLDFDIERFGQCVRDHWQVENGLHWAMDVIFREDYHRYQKKQGAANLSLMRKMALGILSRDKTVKKGKATKQMKAISSGNYRDHLLKNCF
jgi:predicted transposase YbfD/YdcC